MFWASLGYLRPHLKNKTKQKEIKSEICCVRTNALCILTDDVFGVQAYLLREVRGARLQVEHSWTGGDGGSERGMGGLGRGQCGSQGSKGTEHHGHRIPSPRPVSEGRMSSQIQWVMVYSNKPKKREAETHEGEWFIISHLWEAGA